MNLRRRALIRLAIGTCILATVVLSAIILLNDDFAVVIHNDSSFAMTDIEVNGASGAWTQRIADIPPGETVAVLVTQDFSESALGIRFRANRTEVAKSYDVYLMYGGRGTTATYSIMDDLEVDLEVDIGWHSGPSWLWRWIV